MRLSQGSTNIEGFNDNASNAVMTLLYLPSRMNFLARQPRRCKPARMSKPELRHSVAGPGMQMSVHRLDSPSHIYDSTPF